MTNHEAGKMELEANLPNLCRQCGQLTENCQCPVKTLVKHTPTPWSFNAENDCIQSDHEDYQFSIIAKIATGEDRMETTNGLFICKAVNEHDTLIAQRDALLATMKEIANRGPVEGYNSVTALLLSIAGIQSTARSAIALCEPKEKELV